MMHYIITITLLLAGLHVAWPFISDEDLAKMAVFPPVVPDIPGEPRGHNKPLGWQRPPEGPIKEYTEPLNANDFWNLHVRDHIPLVYRQYIKDSPAISKWDDEYLTKTYGDLDVLVEHKAEDRTSTSGRMRITDFLKHYNDSDMYVVSMLPSDMMKDIKAIPSVLCGTFRTFTHESNLWISAGGTRSVVHYDADHNLHCMISGRKDMILTPNNITTKTNLYYKKKDPNSGSGFSFLDPDTIDMNKFKRIAKVPWVWATLYPGDCIFIPSRYIHQVRGYGRTLAVTTLFTADVANNFNGDGCTDDIMKGYHSMSEIPFQWTYKKGDPTIDMGYMNVELVKHRVVEMLKDPEVCKDGKMSMKVFAKAVGAFGAYGRNVTKIKNVWLNEFKLPKDFKMTEKAVNEISLENWKKLCRAVEAPHGVVTDGSEPVFVKPGERHRWETEHPDEDEGDDRMTEREREMHEASNFDPMLLHLSDAEKIDYIEKIKQKKEKYGHNMEQYDELLKTLKETKKDGSSSRAWVSTLTWALDEIPDKYKDTVMRGKIPPEFKDQFLEGVGDVISERFKDDFAKNIIPKELLNELSPDTSRAADFVNNKKRGAEKDDEGEGDAEGGEEEGDQGEEGDGAEGDERGEGDEGGEQREVNTRSGYNFEAVEEKNQKMILQQKVPPEEKDALLKFHPEHKDEIEKGSVSLDLLSKLFGTDSVEDVKEDLVGLRKEFGIRDEL